ncbi:MAG: pyrroline-5-carboxylate reductase [Casimicrobiaceae bacterium]
MTTQAQAITFIGGGNMATALIGGLLAGNPQREIAVIEPAPAAREALAQRFPQAALAPSAAECSALARTRLVVLAVKPQVMRDAVRPLVPFLGASGPVVLTIAAGIRLADLGRWLDGHALLVRAMPNTPALVGKGIAGLYALPGVSDPDRQMAADVLLAGGEVVWVDEERSLDAVTGISGSGAAYVFYFMEALERAAREQGFAPDRARQLAHATFVGAVALAESSDTPPATLRAQVTSKGGTTERALATLEQRGVGDAIVAAAKAATDRAGELGDQFGRDPGI